jgi:hypothetical protein
MNKQTLYYFVYLIAFVLLGLELGLRFLSQRNDDGVDLLLGKKHRYLLPLPTDSTRLKNSLMTNSPSWYYRTFDDTLGWSHQPWGLDTMGFHCYANNRGMRITKTQYQSRIPAQSHYRYLTIGNSFTHGDAVLAEESWPFLLANSRGVTHGNLAVGGFGLQQALLRFLYSKMTADTVFFGVISGDFDRTIEPVINFTQGGNKTRPLIYFDSKDSMRLFNVPVLKPKAFFLLKEKHEHAIFSKIPHFSNLTFSKGLWTKSYVSRLLVSLHQQSSYFSNRPVYLTDDQYLEDCIKIFKVFNDFCVTNNMVPIILLLDNSNNFHDVEVYGLENPWSLVKEKLNHLNIKYLDFHDTLKKVYDQQPARLIHPDEGIHYSIEGNVLVSELIQMRLKEVM